MRGILLDKLKLFFPSMNVTPNQEDTEEGHEGEDRFELLTEPQAILAYLQTLFFEERLIEVQIDSATRVFFAALWDFPPLLDEQDEEGKPVVDPEYGEGDYLQELNHIALSPLEPVVGNIRIRSSAQVILRFYTGTTAVELGTYFIRADAAIDSQVLLLEFPAIGRIIPNSRPFRARIPEHTALEAIINSPIDGVKNIRCKIIDISAMGMLIEHDNLHERLERGDNVTVTILSEGKEEISINGGVRHFARLRTKKGSCNICGMQFDLESRAMAGEIERLFARVQRTFLRSLSSRTAGRDINLKLL